MYKTVTVLKQPFIMNSSVTFAAMRFQRDCVTVDHYVDGDAAPLAPHGSAVLHHPRRRAGSEAHGTGGGLQY